MVFDICIRVRDIGEIFGSYHKASKNSVYLRNAMINKSASVTIALMKLEKKFIISVSRMAIPSFELFTNEQLRAIAALQNPAYTEEARKVLAQRAAQETSRAGESRLSRELSADKGSPTGASAKDKQQPAKPRKSRKEWDQFEANERLFGVKSEFDINEYATGIDRNAPGYKELEEKSLKIAREIMSQSTLDLHRLEERGIQRSADVSDDRAYSTVDLEDRWAEQAERSLAKETARSVSPQRMAILKELEEVEKVINDSKGVSGGWTGLVIQILSRKKSLIEKLKALDEEPQRIKETLAPSPPPAAEKKVPGEAHLHPPRRSRSRENPKRPDPSTSFEMTFAPGVKMNLDEGPKGVSSKGARSQRNGGKKHQDGTRAAQLEAKPSKQIVIGGGALEYANGHECIEAIKHSFRRRRSDEESRQWGNGPSVEDIYSVHMSPLDPFEIPPEKINDIMKAIQRDAEAVFRKHK